MKQVKEKRDNKAVQESLVNLFNVATSGEKIIVATVRAVKNYATVGEIVGELRKVYGKWQPTKIF